MKHLFKAVMLAIALSITGFVHADKPFGSASDVNFAMSLWKSMQDNKLVGADAINVFPFNGNQPHGAVQQVTDSVIEVKNRLGRVIVKRNHGGDGANVKSVYANPNKYIKAVTVMFKREQGYDSENLDWFWAKYSPNGTLDKNPKGIKLAGRVAKGAAAGCLACHKALGGKDLETLTER